jgi:alkylation response protein AidB-like acyl-CoA dehydrogenase
MTNEKGLNGEGRTVCDRASSRAPALVVHLSVRVSGDTMPHGNVGYARPFSGDRSEEYAALASVASDLMARVCPVAAVRAAWDSAGTPGPHAGQARARVAALWAALGDGGLTAAVVPEDYGGLGLGEPGLAIIARAAGLVALPTALVESAVAALAIADTGAHEQRSRWLPEVASGQAWGTLAVAAPWSPGTDALDLVPYADSADFLIHVAVDRVRLLERHEYTATRRSSADRARPLYRVEAVPGAGVELSRDTAAARRVLDQAAVATAATLCGLSMHLVQVTTDYVTIRHQFGQAVGAFQAVKHRLADAYVALTMAWPTCWDAAVALGDRVPDASLRASIAKVFASDMAAIVNDHALQCHGGIGFSWESDLHLWLKRGKALERAYGSAREHRRIVSEHLFVTETDQVMDNEA